MYNGMSNAATDASVGAEKKSRKTESNLDLFLFLQGMNMADANARKAYLFDNVDLPKMINFMAVNTVTGNIDLHSKNYYIYSDSGKTNLWTLLPWDLDLSQGRLWTSWNNYFDDGIYLNAGGTISGTGQNLVARMYAVPELANMAKRRIRSLQDKFFKTSATAPDMTRWYDTRVSQMAAQFGASLTIGQNDTPGMDAALDFSKYAAAAWKNHTGTNNNTAASTFAANTMSLEIQRVMSSWVVQRINTINADTGNVPAAYNVAALTPLTFSVVEHSPASGDQDQEYIEITNPNVLHLDLSGWQITGGVTFTFEPGTVVNGNNKIYVAASRNAFKARTTGPRGGQSLNVTGGFLGHLSNLGETLNLLDDTGTQRATFSYTGSPTPHQQHLAVTEIMYNPGGSGQAEFIEITNLSSTETLGMGNVRFNAGVDFNFTGSPVTSLAPGARALIVKNLAAFTAIHGNSLPVAGEFLNSTGLNNTGEVLKLEDPGGNTVKEFAYSSLAPWPAANGTGSSIVLMRPELNPDPALPQNWRASIAAGGNPGADDAVRFSGIATGDVDADGLPAIVEYVLGTSDGSPGGFGFQPVMGTDGTGARIVDVTLLRRLNADDATFRLESSSDLTTWNPTGWALRTSTPAGSGMVSEQWRLTLTPSAPDKAYVRCSCSRR